MALYEEKIDAAIDRFYEDIVTLEQPILSSWYDRVFELYLDLHLDGTEHPDFVLDFVRRFSRLMGIGVREVEQVGREDLIAGLCLHPQVEEYFEVRRQYIMDNGIETTFLYWWQTAGLPRESVLSEGIHNILAWGQLVNILFLVIRARLQGYTTIENLLQGSVVAPPIDFFDLHRAAGADEAERVNVAREAYRMLMPNQAWFSSAETSNAGYNDGRVFSDPNFDRTHSLHYPLIIQAINDNYNPLTFQSDLGHFDTGRYADFMASGCPFASGQEFDVTNDFTASNVDGETVVPRSHAEYFPVFEAGEKPGLWDMLFPTSPGDNKINGPKYCPFGLGCKYESIFYLLLPWLICQFLTRSIQQTVGAQLRF